MNKTSRRMFLTALGTGATAPLLARPGMFETRIGSPPGDFRLRLGSRDHHHLSYHMDGQGAFYRPEVMASLEKILEQSVGYFRGTEVNLFNFNLGSYEIAHDLGIEPHVGPGANAPYESTLEWRIHENFKYHLKRGLDPISEIITATRSAGVAFICNFRMNEIHHSAWTWHSKFWVDHPEYRINEPVAWDKRGWGALDYAHRAVRDHRKTLLTAYLDRYDTDGVELDFNRFPLLFKVKEADQHRDTLTAFIRELRDLVEQVAVRRGHRIYLMARVPSVARQCHKIGLDVLRWIRDELVDVVVCAHPRYAEFEMPVEEFLEVAGGRKVLVFAGFEPLFTEVAGASHSLLTPEMWRAVATHYWKAGIDGLQLFNNHYYRWNDQEESHLKEIASPAFLERANKKYQVTRRLKGVSLAEKGGFESYITYPKQLPVDLVEGQTATVRIFMDDALAHRPSIRLRLRMDGMTPPDRFGVTLNGHPLDQVVRTPYTDRGSRVHPPGSYEGGQGMYSQWVEGDISNLEWMREGANQVEVRLEKRNPAVASPLVLSNVEFDVKYSR